jgi:3-oxoacyl-[acyl-carrier protein] reductase
MTQNKVAVITGGSGQLGSAISRALADRGVQIVSIVRKDLDNAQAILDSLPNQELGHIAILASVTDSSSLKAAAELVNLKIGKCDILINNAGRNAPRPADLAGLTDDMIDDIIDTNIKGTILTTREFLNLLNKSTESVIINISSASSISPRRANPLYATSKGAINVLTQSLAIFLSPKIRVVAVAPGILPLPVSGTTPIKFPTPGHQEEWIKNNIPLQKMASADDVAEMVENVVFGMKQTTGCILSVDGGVTI